MAPASSLVAVAPSSVLDRVVRARAWRVLPLLLALAAPAVTAGCHAYEPLPQLVSLVDVGPRSTTQGDTLELTGASFPVKKAGRVVLLGDLLRPGQEPERQVEIEAEGVSPDGTRVEPNQPVAKISGAVGTILSAERVLLNFLGHLSGIRPCIIEGCEGLMQGRQCRGHTTSLRTITQAVKHLF